MSEFYQCSMSLQCKSKECHHAKPHQLTGCDSNAPCGQWPNNKDFKPMVKCISKELVKPLEDCPKCGATEMKGHHAQDCISNLLKQNESLQARIDELEAENKELKESLLRPSGCIAFSTNKD